MDLTRNLNLFQSLRYNQLETEADEKGFHW